MTGNKKTALIRFSSICRAGSDDRQRSLRVVRDTPKPLWRMVLSRASQSKALRLGRQAGAGMARAATRAPARLLLGVSQRLAGTQVRYAERRGRIAEGSDLAKCN